MQNVEPRSENRELKIKSREVVRKGWLVALGARSSLWLRVITHIACLVPFALLLWDYEHHNLTANPIQAITDRTGNTAIIILVLSLACTPVNTVFGLKQVLPLRRPLGLYAFFYACLHFLTFVGLDYGFDWDLIKGGVIEKPYVLVGLTAFILLIPLALTSTKASMRRLGKRWKSLHRAIYVIGLLVVLHWFLLVKSDVREPLLYGAGIVLLLALRTPVVKQWFAKLRHHAT